MNFLNMLTITLGLVKSFALYRTAKTENISLANI